MTHRNFLYIALIVILVALAGCNSAAASTSEPAETLPESEAQSNYAGKKIPVGRFLSPGI